MEMRIMSMEDMKPETPTPPDLRSYHLSSLDQLNRLSQVPMVYFYPPPSSHDQPTTNSKLSRLRNSLSETLAHFYPFAGKLAADGLVVDCDDRGARYVEAQIVDYTLQQILSRPDHDLVAQLIPSDEGDNSSYLLMVQVNVFRCGGIAIAFSWSHKIADGSAALFFFQAWANASTARRQVDDQLVIPTFPASSLFPQNPTLTTNSSMCPWLALRRKRPAAGGLSKRRFVFDPSGLSKLRMRSTSSDLGRPPSRFESVVALIWSRAMAASAESNCGRRRTGVLVSAFDLRTRMKPHLTDQAFGNLYWKEAIVSESDADRELQRLVKVIREGMSEIEERVSEIRNDVVAAYDRFLGVVSKQDGDSTDFFSCSSVMNRGLYEADFGFGRPKWVCRGTKSSAQLNNWIFLMDMESGGGIEVWVTMEPNAMAVLEKDDEVLEFASLDPPACF